MSITHGSPNQTWYEKTKVKAVKEARTAYLAAATQYFRDSPAPSHFPWERSLSERAAAGGRRRLLDAFGDSLRHVNRLLDQEFGPDSRKVTQTLLLL